jgi:hypothetical protein
MKRMLNLVVICMLFSSCTESNTDTSKTICLRDATITPEWLLQIMNDYSQLSDTKAAIYSYQYKGKCVFMVNDCVDCADNLLKVYNFEGTVICEFGGIIGLNSCPDFQENAKHKERIWSNY